jgi:hypothetical protein
MCYTSRTDSLRSVGFGGVPLDMTNARGIQSTRWRIISHRLVRLLAPGGIAHHRVAAQIRTELNDIEVVWHTVPRRIIWITAKRQIVPPGAAKHRCRTGRRNARGGAGSSRRLTIESPGLQGSLALKGGRTDDLVLARYHLPVDNQARPPAPGARAGKEVGARNGEHPCWLMRTCTGS